MTALDPTLTRNVGKYLVILAAELTEALDLQDQGQLDAEQADKAAAQARSDLRLIDRHLAELQKGTRAAWEAEVVAALAADPHKGQPA